MREGFKLAMVEEKDFLTALMKEVEGGMNRILKWLKNNWLIKLTIAWLIIGLILPIIYLGIYHNVTWDVLTGFATWVLAGGVFLAFIQIRESRKSTNAQIAVEFFRELRSGKVLKILRFIYELNPKEPVIVYFTDVHRIDYILDRFDFLAVLVRKGIIDPDLAVDPYAGVSVLRCWYILYKYIDEVRSTRKYYGYNFEWFTNVCMEYFDKHGIEVGFKNQYGVVNDLVIKLKSAKEEKDEDKKTLYPRSWDEIEKELKNKPNQQKTKDS